MLLLIDQLFYSDQWSYFSLQNHTTRKETGNSNFGGGGSYGNVSIIFHLCLVWPVSLHTHSWSMMKTINRGQVAPSNLANFWGGSRAAKWAQTPCVLTGFYLKFHDGSGFIVHSLWSVRTCPILGWLGWIWVDANLPHTQPYL